MGPKADLAQQINHEHTLVQAPSKAILNHAIRCGELLLEAQQQVKKGIWVTWMDEHLEMHRTTAFGYMRLARNKEKVLSSGVSGIDPALAMLSTGKTLSDSERQEIYRQYHQEGVSLDDLAQEFGVRKSTIWYWVSSKNRDRQKTLQRRQRERAFKALDREGAGRAAKKAGGSIARLYSLVRQAQSVADKEIGKPDLTSQQRVALREALDSLYRAEDKIGEAIREVTTKESQRG